MVPYNCANDLILLRGSKLQLLGVLNFEELGPVYLNILVFGLPQRPVKADSRRESDCDKPITQNAQIHPAKNCTLNVFNSSTLTKILTSLQVTLMHVVSLNVHIAGR